MMKYLLTLLIILPLSLLAQVNVSGKVTDLSTSKPIENASVILSNSTIGSTTGANGAFTLHAVKPGQYDLVVSIIGYETYHLTLLVSTANVLLPGIGLLSKSVALQEVVIKPNAEYARNFKIFKEEFLGSTPDAKRCKIINPDVVQLSYDKQMRRLTASSYDFIEIENPALGYKIKYLVNSFVKDFANSMLTYEGSVLFQEMPGTPAQVKRWKKLRNQAYYGSLQHFLKSSLRNRFEVDGFETLQLIRTPNPRRPPEYLIQEKLDKFRPLAERSKDAADSLDKWAHFAGMAKTTSSLVKTPFINTFELIKRTDQKGIYALSYPNHLYVMYTKKHDDSINTLTVRPVDVPDFMTTIVSFQEKYALFDDNGSLINPTSLMFEGAWGLNRVASMLPVDFEPEDVL